MRSGELRGVMPAKVYRIIMKPSTSILAEVSKLPGTSIQVHSVIRARDKAHTLVKIGLLDSRKIFPKIVETLSRRREVLDYRILEKKSSSCTILLTKSMCDFYEYTIASERHTFFPYVISGGLRRFYLMTSESYEDLEKALSRYGVIISLEKATFQEALRETSQLLSVELVRDSLTPLQRKALSEALRRGFFEWPRRVSLEELSRELGISKVTLSEHLRRGERKLLESILGNGSQ